MTTDREQYKATLSTLAAQHEAEERGEAQRNLLDMPRPQKTVLPEGGLLPLSQSYLDRLYAEGRMAKEKKPGLFDHLRSAGPWMVSIDETPLSVLDGMSQTATLTHGFAVDEVVQSYMNGVFGESPLIARDTSIAPDPDLEKYASLLASKVPQLNHVSFTNSGAEANEKAFALCRPTSAFPNAKKVLGFQGSFHGRTLLALQTTWNPVKRAPFELPSYQSVFAEYPLMDATQPEETEIPEGFYDALSQAPSVDKLQTYKGSHSALFDHEIDCLTQVLEAAQTGEVFTVIIEPMQSEGGDRYASARFYRCLRLLTRSIGLPLIFDEVQTGFGLGGPFDWSSKFGLVKADGTPDAPDAITYAKRAQVGVCISRFEDPEPTSAHVASMIRARITTSLMDFGPTAEQVEAFVKPRLSNLSDAFGDLIHAPRCTGFAFAFDLPSQAHLMTYLGQRFWRGAVVFGAGTKTVRYRLSNAFGPHHIERLFETIEQSLNFLRQHGDAKPPTWVDATRTVSAPRVETRIRRVEQAERSTVLERILEIESEVYEPARQDSRETLAVGFTGDEGIAVVAEVHTETGWSIVGSALAGPMEAFPDLDGPKQDPAFGEHNSAYSIALTLLPAYQGLGLGRRLKQAQLVAVRDCVRTDGSPRYTSIVGRNRVGMTDSMGHLNDSFGAYTERIIAHQYGTENGQARYYRIPLRGFALKSGSEADKRLHWSGGLSAPFRDAPDSLKRRAADGTLFGPTVNKVTICNYVTPSVVRAVEWVGALAPEYPHLYLSSGRDELIDKSVRLLRYQRKNAETCLSFTGSYVGHTSATARSISCPSVHQQGDKVFDWPSVRHPSQGLDGCIAELDKAIAKAGGADQILGLFVEPLGERSGQVLTKMHADRLNDWSTRTGIPLISVETAAYCRGFTTPFGYQDIGLNAAIMAWWPGGQTGFLHVQAPYFIEKPLMMVSTWDGDELSMIRAHHQSMALVTQDWSNIRQPIAELCHRLQDAGLSVFGQGAYRLLDAGTAASAFAHACAQDGLVLRAFANGLIPLALPLDLSPSDMEQGAGLILKHAHLITAV